jgi:hypothetical protein
MNEPYLLQTLAYVELNPVKANTPYNYCWSSAKAHKKGQDPKDKIKPNQLQAIYGDWEDYLKQAQKQPIVSCKHTTEQEDLWVVGRVLTLKFNALLYPDFDILFI